MTARDENELRSADNMRHEGLRVIVDSNLLLRGSNSGMRQLVSPRNKSEKPRGAERS